MNDNRSSWMNRYRNDQYPRRDPRRDSWRGYGRDPRYNINVGQQNTPWYQTFGIVTFVAILLGFAFLMMLVYPSGYLRQDVVVV